VFRRTLKSSPGPSFPCLSDGARRSAWCGPQLGVSNAIIGLFVVAIGTSLPELVTSMVAAIRGESDLAVGNVVGSNIFNGLFVLPTSGLISDVAVPDGGVIDVLVSMAFAVLLVTVFYFARARISRAFGAAFLSCYFLYALTRLG
jgi:cation:H+ antiporter